jgi:hypothetical protein
MASSKYVFWAVGWTLMSFTEMGKTRGETACGRTQGLGNYVKFTSVLDIHVVILSGREWWDQI